jgi:gamma-glutamyltranspeptidase/glutathione hydrolase
MSGPFAPIRRAAAGRCVLVPLTLAAALVGLAPARAASRPAVTAPAAMAVTSEDQATRAAVAAMREGGNAVDAAVAAAFVLAVTAPDAGNLGGGGFLLYRRPDGEVLALDFRETAPRGLRAKLFLDDDGRPVPGRSLRGGLAVGVPGSVAGLFEAHRRWGSLPWRRLLAPAVGLADGGSVVSPHLGRVFRGSGGVLLEEPSSRAVFARNGGLPREGERLVQPDLAVSLRRIAEQGRDGFYSGPTAEALERSVREAGGVLDREDLAAYETVLRQPLVGSYRGHRVVSFPPPSSGGVALLQMLGMLERFDLRTYGPGSSRTVHLLAEVERRAFADRSRWLGDPAFFDVPVEGLLDDAYLAGRVAGVDPRRATPSSRLAPGVAYRPEPEDTLHFSVADPRGGAVALTTTLNAPFGSGRVAEGTGILLNNEIDDFALAPGVPNLWGLVGAEANRVEGRKRPLSSMTPTIVEAPGGGPRPVLVLGSPGGAKIITSVLQVLLNLVDHDMPLQEAVDFPRCHHQWLPDVLRHERRAFAEDVRRALVERGHSLEESPPLGNVNAIGIDGEGRWLGAADPRRQGSARGF